MSLPSEILKVKANDHIAVWFSRGAASAVAAKMTVQLFPHCRVSVLTNPLVEEHPDNYRFERDIQNWLGMDITQVTNSKFPNGSAVEIWDAKKAMSFPEGAPCTDWAKKRARQEWEKRNDVDWHVLGFTSDEEKRHRNFTLTERDNVIPTLIELGIDKQACVDILEAAGITVPEMYRLGFPNANCMGCVKATSPTYWNATRLHFPDVFDERARQSRRLGVRLARVKGVRIFLDELDPNAQGRPMKSMKLECGTFCEVDL